MALFLSLSRAIDAVTAFVGRWIYWLILAAVLVSAGNAIIRKLFDISSNAWLELQWYLFGAVFMLAAAYTLQRNEHIRIDIISNMLSQRARNWIDIVGHVLFLLPFCALMIYELCSLGAEQHHLGRDVRQRRRSDPLAGAASAC